MIKLLLQIPPNIDTLYNKGNAFVNLGRYNDAIEWYNRVLATNPDYHDALINKGVLIFNLGRVQMRLSVY